MKKYFFSILVLLILQLNVVSAEIPENATMSVQATENGLGISLNNIDISNISDCYWGEVSIYAKLIEKIQKEKINISQNGSQTNINIPLSEIDEVFINNNPIFSIVFSSGESLSSSLVFDAEDQNTRGIFSWVIKLLNKILKPNVVDNAGGAINSADNQYAINKVKTFINDQVAKGIYVHNKSTSTGMNVYVRYDGNTDKLKRTFYSLKPQNIKISQQNYRGYTGFLFRGMLYNNRITVIARRYSQDGRPTLQFQYMTIPQQNSKKKKNKGKIKTIAEIRYGHESTKVKYD
jgi:hypothetical protein